jgi:glyoxylase-like metal-dependent hydrolase (beta-lactamase superfamily II)
MTSHRWTRDAVLALLLLGTCAAGADAPQVKTQAPGYYRMMLGAFEVTVLSDGTFPISAVSLLTRTTPEAVKQALAQAFLPDPLENSDNAFLINTGSKLVLVDTGCAAACGPATGNLLANLRAAGYRPEQVDEIYITHMHGDHIGGLTAGGQPVFSRAIVRADRAEADFWLSPAKRAAAPKDRQASFDTAVQALQPYVTAGRFKPFDGNGELVPGVRAVVRHGHTPGHTTYLVESQGQTLALWGDLMHVAAIQFAHPEVTIKFDTDQDAAAKERAAAYAEAAQKGYWVAATHLSFPGLGHLRSAGTGYVFVPANYTALR